MARSDKSLWERLYDADAPVWWTRWAALDSHPNRRPAIFWRRVRRRLARRGVPAELANDEAVREAIAETEAATADNQSERHLARLKLVLAYRAAGLTYKQMGERLGGVSATRARDLHAKAERVERGHKAVACRELSPKVEILIGQGYTDDEIVSVAELLRTPLTEADIRDMLEIWRPRTSPT